MKSISYNPQIGDLMYNKKGRWYTFGMIVERSAEDIWIIEWYYPKSAPKKEVGYDIEMVNYFHEQYLNLRKEYEL